MTSLLTLLSCNKNEYHLGDETNPYESAYLPIESNGGIPILFRMNDIVGAEVEPMSTRADGDALYDPLLVDRQIGLFIIVDTDYQRVLQGLAPTSGYHYYNIRGTVLDDGSISVEDTLLYYPLYKEAQIAVVAYSPYNPQLSNRVLYEGLNWQLESDQTVAEFLYESDLLVGHPIDGNPIRCTLDNNMSTVTIPLSFYHRCSRIIVDVEIPKDRENLLCENVLVNICNIPIQANHNLFDGNSQIQETSIGQINMLNALYSTGEVDDEVTRFRATAIVQPQQYDSQLPPEIHVTLQNRYAGRADTTIVRKDLNGTDFSQGRDVNYLIKIN